MIIPSTKFIPPHKRAALIDRPGLRTRIDRSRESRLLLVCAPAGYGKTTALIQAHDHLRAQGARVSWISIDEDDRDLSRFATYLLHATGCSGASRQQAVPWLLGNEIQRSPEALVTSVLNELALMTDETCVILDDYHLVTDPAIRHLVNTILLAPVPQLRFLIGSRTHNELPLGRLRALGQVHEMEIADLTFTADEVGEFVARVRGAPLAPGQVHRLREITESWAASLQMIGIALQDVDDVDAFLDRFSGAHRTVSDFLSDEVLKRQPPDLQEFLVLTSMLGRFNGSLCNAVTGREDGRTMIEELERRNLFLFSLDQERRWFRYHPLFSGFLRQRLVERYPERLRECHARASRWLAEARFMTDAIEHAFEAGEVGRAGELLDRASSDLLAAGQTTTLMSLSARLPASLLERLPRLQLERAWYSELSWQFDMARTALARVQAVLDDPDAALRPGSDEHRFLESKLAHRQMMLKVLSDDMPGTVRLAQQWLAQDRTQDPFMNASTGTALLNAHRVMFRCEGVQTSARMLQARYVEGGAMYGIVFHQCVIGAAHFERGDLASAQEAYEHALEVAIELQGEHSALYNMPALLLGELCYEKDRLELAAEMLAERDIVSELGFVDNLIAGFTVRAGFHALRGHADDADALLAEGAWFAQQRGFARMEAAMLHERTRLLLLAGKVDDAQALYRSFARATAAPPSPAPGPDVTLTDLLLALAAARLQLQRGESSSAADLMKRWFHFARRRHCHRSALRAGVLLARALLQGGERRAALRALHECLLLGHAGGFVRVFVDEGDEIRDLLAEIARIPDVPGGARIQEYAGTVLSMLEEPGARDNTGSARAVPELREDVVLSAREVQILELGAQGLQNTDIAQSLFLAQSTVKWYWQRIYERLGVRRRPDAIRIARSHHWIR